jgi:hypothetical protein
MILHPHGRRRRRNQPQRAFTRGTFTRGRPCPPGSPSAEPPPPCAACRRRGPARVRSHCRFRNRGTEYVSRCGIKWMSGRTERRCDRALRTLAKESYENCWSGMTWWSATDQPTNPTHQPTNPVLDLSVPFKILKPIYGGEREGRGTAPGRARNSSAGSESSSPSSRL